AFQALKEGRLPEWDPTIYCGMSFAGNLQAALFYPPNWLLYLFNSPRMGISFKSIEFFVALHFATAFLLTYGWLRFRQFERVACLLGAVTFAFSGYIMGDIQHLGISNGYTWFPLALWGIDQRSIPKTAAACALCFLAGYPSTWLALCATTAVYALA